VSGQIAVALDNARLYEESKRAYKQLRVAHERLIRSEKLTALGVLASGIAHDFNNVLTTILGRAQMALSQPVNHEVKHNLEIIEQAAVDASGMVRKIQHFARVKSDNTFDIIDMGETLRSTLEMIKPYIEEHRQTSGTNIELVLDIAETDQIEGDAVELREALINIFINAIEAMPDGGKLTVKSTQDDEFVVISISDTGVGMTAEVRRRIFDPFFTTKGQEGLGMGLSVVYGVVQRHRGKIDVSSKPRKGSTFTIRIPVVEKRQKDVATQFKQRNIKGTSILVVNNDEEPRNALYVLLTNNGCNVDIAGTGKEAISLAQRRNYDIVLTDSKMADISGLEIAAKIKIGSPETQVALVSGQGVQLDLTNLQERGISHTLAKPFTNEDILEIVRKLLDYRDHTSSN
jgi:nitrogen-specific signal transduction histidine kinase/ActR/RegA family two-component response regulator